MMKLIQEMKLVTLRMNQVQRKEAAANQKKKWRMMKKFRHEETQLGFKVVLLLLVEKTTRYRFRRFFLRPNSSYSSSVDERLCLHSIFTLSLKPPPSPAIFK
jgi:hypothetical protein